MTFPRSPLDTLGGLVYFPRMLDKIRLKQRGELAEGYFALLGGGFDGRLTRYLGISYADLATRIENGASDDEILNWTRSEGFPVAEEHIAVWNGFCLKRGHDDDGTPTLDRFKQEKGWQDRHDLSTFFAYIDAEEGR